ncbi:MAG: zinc-ribbon domain-containing protein [Clostridia bacterium]|nr:zinc-ribbon domain-containing protein [Clostridia bacterium]
MFCSKCGNEIVDDAVVCTKCGCAVKGANSISAAAAGDDVPNGGLNILSFFVPLVGLILYCTMQSKTPRKAKQIGIFALVGFIINLVLVTVMSM